MKDPNSILQEQVFPALDRVEAGGLTDEDAIKGLQQAVYGMMEASNLKLKQAETTEKREIIERLQLDLITLDIYLSTYDLSEPSLSESLHPEIDRIFSTWQSA